MECGNMKSLSGALYGKGFSTSASSQSNPPCSLVSSLTTPRSQTTSSTHATPRGSIRSTGGGSGLGSEDFGGHMPPWAPSESERAVSPRTRQSPRVSRRLTMASRDKESLLEEIIQLKKLLVEQSNLIRHKNAQNSRVGLRNRKLEMDLEDLETSLQLEAPRTGSPQRLRSKLQGLQLMVEELQETCDLQREELLHLRRDIRVTRTREIEVERDVFAGEIRRLQKVLKRMQQLQNRINCENRDLGRLKNKYQKLEIANLRLEGCMTAKSIRPQSQPGTSRKNVPYDQDGRQMHLDRSHIAQDMQVGHQKPRP